MSRKRQPHQPRRIQPPLTRPTESATSDQPNLIGFGLGGPEGQLLRIEQDVLLAGSPAALHTYLRSDWPELWQSSTVRPVDWPELWLRLALGESFLLDRTTLLRLHQQAGRFEETVGDIPEWLHLLLEQQDAPLIRLSVFACCSCGERGLAVEPHPAFLAELAQDPASSAKSPRPAKPTAPRLPQPVLMAC